VQTVVLYPAKTGVHYPVQTVVLYLVQTVVFYPVQTVVLYHVQRVVPYPVQTVVLYPVQTVVLYPVQTVQTVVLFSPVKQNLARPLVSSSVITFFYKVTMETSVLFSYTYTFARNCIIH
jgi:hypothetical protein